MTTDHTITYSVFEPKKPRSDRSPFLLSLLLSLPVHPPAEQPHTCRSPDLRILTFIRLPGLPVAGLRLNEYSPITVAGPLRNCTGFPLSFPPCLRTQTPAPADGGKNMCGSSVRVYYTPRGSFSSIFVISISPDFGFPSGVFLCEDLLVFLHVFFILGFGADFDADGLDFRSFERAFDRCFLQTLGL